MKFLKDNRRIAHAKCTWWRAKQCMWGRLFSGTLAFHPSCEASGIRFAEPHTFSRARKLHIYIAKLSTHFSSHTIICTNLYSLCRNSMEVLSILLHACMNFANLSATKIAENSLHRDWYSVGLTCHWTSHWQWASVIAVACRYALPLPVAGLATPSYALERNTVMREADMTVSNRNHNAHSSWSLRLTWLSANQPACLRD